MGNDLAASCEPVERALHNLGELRVVLAEHQRVVGVGKEIADDAIVGAGFRLGENSVELHVVIRKGVRFTGGQQLE